MTDIELTHQDIEDIKSLRAYAWMQSVLIGRRKDIQNGIGGRIISPEQVAEHNELRGRVTELDYLITFFDDPAQLVAETKRKEDTENG